MNDVGQDITQAIADLESGRYAMPSAFTASGDASRTLDLGPIKARPLSLGVQAVLEEVRHPLIVGGDAELSDLSSAQWAEVLYAHCGDIDDLVAYAQDAAAYRAAALAWAMSIAAEDLEDATVAYVEQCLIVAGDASSEESDAMAPGKKNKAGITSFISRWLYWGWTRISRRGTTRRSGSST